jgi:nucleoid-associated protein YgaU
MTRTVRAAAWLATLLAAGLALRAADTGTLATPPLTSGGALVDWVAARDPIAAAVALGRLLAEVGVWYVLAVSALHALAEVGRSAGAGHLADALALPAVSRLVRTGIGVGLAATSTLPAATPTPPRAAADLTIGVAATAGTPSTATMEPVVALGTAVAAPTGDTASMRPAPRPEPDRAPEPAPLPPPATWTTEPGDSLWSIAAEVLSDVLGRPATDAEVDPFWRALVQRNRGRLVDPGDPDLIHPGQVFEVPPLPPAPG